MHESHWGLRESPFRGSPDPRFFYESPTHDEALARLGFLVATRRRLGILLGASGSGKSLLLQVFARQIRRQGGQAAVVNLLGLDVHEFLWTLAAQLGLNPGAEAPCFTLWRGIADRITENRYQRLRTVILLDDADRATGEMLVNVERLMQIDPDPKTPITIVLASGPERCDRLGKRLLQLAELRIELEAWEEPDTSNYLTDSIAKAGRSAPVFDEPATSRLHELCHGVPRQISQLAELALLAGAGQKLDHIDQHTVESAFEELSACRAASSR
jgi:type II secretory pathway predicted ATPase ExeA